MVFVCHEHSLIVGVLTLRGGELYQSAVKENLELCQESWIWIPRYTYGESICICIYIYIYIYRQS